ncbi:MAG TPA: hypothetical protein VFA49_02950, partial [Chloroflexota bacterium]|nr:hypothetical protein [Chloroflexota bacterium]
MPRHQAVLVGLVLLVSYAYFYQAGGWNQNSRFDLVRALIERGTPRIDAYETNTGDKAVVEGHTYTDKAPGQSLTALPPVALGEVILRAAGRDVGGAAEQSLLSYVATIWAAGLPTVAAALCLAWTARCLGSSAGGAGFVALVYGLATPAWA